LAAGLQRYCAGLVSFGLNGIALSCEYGCRQHFVVLPTTALLRPAERLLYQHEVCDGCWESLINRGVGGS
jgi:hypothetical protein